jgi:hypothetical protein
MVYRSFQSVDGQPEIVQRSTLGAIFTGAAHGAKKPHHKVMKNL